MEFNFIKLSSLLRSKNMQLKNYLYSFSYANTESDLCKLESRSIFNKEEKNKLLFSDIKAEPRNLHLVLSLKVDLILFRFLKIILR